MKRILCSLLVVILPFGSVLADTPKSKNAKVSLVYQHELPNVPGKSIKGVLVEYGPGGSTRPRQVNPVLRLIATPNHRRQILLQSQSHQETPSIQISGVRLAIRRTHRAGAHVVRRT